MSGRETAVCLIALIALLVDCGRPDPGEPAAPAGGTLAGTTPAEADLARLLPPSGPFEVGVLPGQGVVVSDAHVSVAELQEFAVGPDRPFSDRQVFLRPLAGTSYPDVVRVVDVLLSGDCMDIRIVDEDILRESARADGG